MFHGYKLEDSCQAFKGSNAEAIWFTQAGGCPRVVFFIGFQKTEF